MNKRTVGRTAGKLAAAVGSKIGMGSKLGNPAKAEAPRASDSAGDGSNRTQIYTYFTKVPIPGESTPILYNGDRLWTRLVLTLETAGPVAVGNSSQITPVLSGKGQLLEPGVPTPFVISKGTRLYISATAVNRVKVVLEPLPWLEQITATLSSLLAKVGIRNDLATGNH